MPGFRIQCRPCAVNSEKNVMRFFFQINIFFYPAKMGRNQRLNLAQIETLLIILDMTAIKRNAIVFHEFLDGKGNEGSIPC